MQLVTTTPELFCNFPCRVCYSGKEGRTFKVYLLVVAPCISNFIFSR